MNPIVSVLVPTFNALPYLRECMDSLVGQTYPYLQIIAINDGSTDSSLDTLRKYAARDSRVEIIDKPNSGYGDSMNCGLQRAVGTYVGILEPDDFTDVGMYEAYVTAAERYGADVVKSDFFEHNASSRRDRRQYLFVEMGIPLDEPFAPKDFPQVITAAPSIWSGLYRRDMLVEHGIDFAPTPGASFQDTSFFHMCWATAETAVVLDRAFLHYRTDNAASSSNSAQKSMAVCAEYDRALAYLRTCGDEKLRALGPALGAARFGAYVWNYNRIAAELREEFVMQWSRELAALAEEGLVDFDLLYAGSLKQAELLKLAPELFTEVYPGSLEWPGYATNLLHR